MKKYLFLVLLLLNITLLFGQDFGFGEVLLKDFEMKKYDKDTTASAVVLREYGRTYISSSPVKLIHQYHVRIKIFNTNGIKHGNVSIMLHKSDSERFEKAFDIEGVTQTMNPGGNYTISQLDKKQVFKENYNKYWDIVKFALPNVQEGSIIEYKYQIESPYIYNYRKWEFQSDIPKIHSEYLAKIPANYNYNIALRGYLKLNKVDSHLEKECFTPGGGFKADCSNMTYIMKDVPAFLEEDYMIAPSNFKSAIYFELKDYTSYTGAKVAVTKEWKDIDHELKTHESFGKQFHKKKYFKDELPLIMNGKSDDMEKAHAIYRYIQNRFKWNGYYGKYSDEGIKKALSKNSGNVGDINLALIAALNEAGLNAEPVILSTRENGIVNKLFPVMSEFNYIVCKLDINDATYMLDATDPLLPFGLLPLRCINDQGRVISMSKPSYWIDLKASQKEMRFYIVDLVLDNDGKLKGKMEISSAGYEGLKKRKKIKSFSTIEEYVEDLDDRMSKVKIIKADIANLDNVEGPLTESYEIEINVYDNLNYERLFFNPFIVDRVTDNPFKLAERTYPVDWGAPSKAGISLKIRFPEQFILQSKPEPVAVLLPAKGGKFLSEVNITNSMLIMNQIIEFNKSVYGPDEYPYLKELYNKIIQSQTFDVVFRKSL